MRVLIAAGEMKGSLSAQGAARAIERGVRAACPDAEIETLALSDGGAGFVDLMVRACGGEVRTARVSGPLGETVDAQWGLIEGGAVGVIEMSAASGLMLVPEDRRDPERTGTYGVGELMRCALEAGCSKLMVGIGNSGTCDGGVGMAAALGVRCTDSQGEMIERPVGGDLVRIARVDASGVDPRVRGTEIEVLCDVHNPLFGVNGSAHVFGPQKGATDEQVERLDAGLQNLAGLGGGVDPEGPGMGAAGGIAFGLSAFCGAMLRAGADSVLDLVEFDDRAAAADLVLTCEGRFDETSLSGKLPWRCAERARAVGKPTLILVGSFEDGARERARGIAEVVAVTPEGMELGEAVRRGGELVERAAFEAVHGRMGG